MRSAYAHTRILHVPVEEAFLTKPSSSPKRSALFFGRSRSRAASAMKAPAAAVIACSSPSSRASPPSPGAAGVFHCDNGQGQMVRKIDLNRCYFERAPRDDKFDIVDRVNRIDRGLRYRRVGYATRVGICPCVCHLHHHNGRRERIATDCDHLSERSGSDINIEIVIAESEKEPADVSRRGEKNTGA